MRLSARALVSLVFIGACGGGGGDDGDDAPPPDGPPLEGDRYSLTWGPFTVQPLQEDTRCVTLRLSNTAPIKVRQVHNHLSGLSHHFIVYRDTAATQDSTTPTPCQPFAGTLNPQAGASPIMITQRTDEILTLPDRVAYTFGAQQFIRLEMHYINSSDVAADATATADFYAVPDSQIDHEAEFLFIGSPDINFTLQPGQTQALNAYFPVPSSLAGINYFALTGHTHQLGTDMDVSTAPSAGGARTEIYNPTPFSWDEPESKRLDFTVPDGGGFDFTCAWTNNGSSPVSVQFGESASQEMCFFWTYYFPSRGAKVCVHSQQGAPFGITDLCCPGSTAAEINICNFVLGNL